MTPTAYMTEWAGHADDWLAAADDSWASAYNGSNWTNDAGTAYVPSSIPESFDDEVDTELEAEQLNIIIYTVV